MPKGNPKSNWPNAGDGLNAIESVEEKQAYITKTMNELMEYARVPAVKTPEEFEDRVKEYFIRCASRSIKPTWEELALACGISRQSLFGWATGQYHSEMQPIAQWAKDTLAAFDAKAVIDGKMFPTTYIFRSKNFYDMKDQQEVVVTPNTIETIPKERLIELAEELPDDYSDE